MKRIISCSKLPIYVFLLLLLGSCVNLKGVKDFSDSSIAAMGQFEKINYTFLDHCEDRCVDEAVRSYQIQRNLDCDCDLFISADSVTQALYFSVQDYLLGIVSLSNRELTTYRTDGFFQAISSKELGPVSIEESQVNAFSKLSSILLRATTDNYRRRKIASYIGEANEPLQVILQKFEQIISINLKGELRFKKERLYVNFMDMKMGSTLDSDLEIRMAGSAYYQALNEINQKERLLDVYSKSLEQIAQGHQVLYDRRDKLSSKELSKELMSYSSSIKSMYSEFNKLND